MLSDYDVRCSFCSALPLAPDIVLESWTASPFNYPQGGKRPLSSTAPLIMDTPDGEVYLAIGGSGGSRIFGAVAQVILNLDWGMDIGNAVEQPRVHDQLEPAYVCSLSPFFFLDVIGTDFVVEQVSIESGYRPDLINALVERGHNISMFDVNVGIAEVQAVLRTEKGMLFGTIFSLFSTQQAGR